jgi:histidine triad (HIT) family protein
MPEVTIFEKILKKEVPANIVFESPQVIAFKDINPQAQIHIVFIHKQKSKDIAEMMENSPDQVKEIFTAIHMFTKMQGLDATGYRIVTNKGADGGQTVFYTHFHLLAGEPLGRFGK